MLDWTSIKKAHEYKQPKLVKAPVVQPPKLDPGEKYTPGGSVNVARPTPEVDEAGKRESLIGKILGTNNVSVKPGYAGLSDGMNSMALSMPGTGKMLAKAYPEKAKRAAEGTEEFYKKNPAYAGFLENFNPIPTKKLVEKNFGQTIDTKEAEDSTAYKVGGALGMIGQFATGYIGAGGAAVSGAKSIAPKLITGLEKAGTKAASKLPKVGMEATEKIGKGATESLVKDIAIGLPLNINQALNKEDLKGKDALKSIGINTGLDIALGGVLEAAPYILKSGKKVATKAEFDGLGADEKLEVIKGVEEKAAVNKTAAQESTGPVEKVTDPLSKMENEKPMAAPETKIESGAKVKALDRDNIGTVESRNSDGTYNVKFVSPEGYTATKTFKADQIEDLTAKPNNYSGDIYTQQLEKDKSYQLSPKAERYQKRQENNFINDVARAMNITKYADRKELKPIVHEAAEKLKNGPISEEEAGELFERMYDQGIITMDAFHKEFKHIKDFIKDGTIKVTEKDMKNIPDFDQFRKDHLGSMKLSPVEGTSIEQKYLDIMDMAPGLLPEVNTTSEMLEELAALSKSIKTTEYSLDQYMGPEAQEFKEYAFEEFKKSISKLEEEAKVIRRFAEDAKGKVEVGGISVGEAKELYKQEAMLRKQAEKVVNSTLLTKKDNIQVDRLLKGEITLDELPAGVNAADIKKVYEAKAAAQDAYRPIKEYNERRKQDLRDTADDLLKNSDQWKDKKGGWRYAREMEERNLVDVAGKEEGEALIKNYITPVHKNEAKRNVMLNTYRDKVKALDIKDKPVYDVSQVYGTADSVNKAKASESSLVQMYGEKKITAEQLNDLGADVGKIQRAAEAMKGLYDSLIEEANEALIKNGYRPIEYRKDYFPHFEEEVPDTILRKVANKLGFDIKKDELPTDIAGLTYAFRPGKKWFGNALQRKGDSTVFDALKGFDMYVEGISDIIHHTDDIQRLRFLENRLRYKYSDEGTRERINEILAMDISETEKDERLSSIYDQSKSQLNNLAQHIRAYTDNLAGKKPLGDRSKESFFGRGIYNFTKQMENRVAANMVAVNPASWLTNLIPLTQGTEVRMASTLKALDETIRSYVKDDGFKEMSDFLINRRGSEPIVMTKTQKLSNTLSSPMKYIDQFTSEVLTRAKYYDELSKGIPYEEAIASADRFAASVIADRSKGGVPLVFESKNPINKLLTMFQVEVNNQLSYLFKDLPRNTKDEGKAVLANALMKYMIGAYLYNDIYESAIGRRPALDPLGMLNEFAGDVSGYQLPNVVEAASDIAGGEIPSLEVDKKNTTQAIGGLAKEAVESLPFIGGLMGGGRIPVSSALPNVANTFNAASGLITGEMNADKAKATLSKELIKPATYLLPPVGGGQAKKVLDTASVISKGGSYGMDSEGNDLLQFPVDKTAGNAVRSAVFGKYSLPGASEWVDAGFKTMGKTATAGWKEAAEAGVTAEQFLYTYREVSKVGSDKDKNGKTINLSKSKNIKAAIDKANKEANPHQKNILYRAFGVSDKVIHPEIKK